MKSFARALILSTALAATIPAMAVEVKGINFGETYQVANQPLQLNGVGVRVKMVFDVYAAGLYLTQKETTTAGVLAQTGAKGVQIVLLRKLTGEEFAEAMIAGFKKNATDAELTKYQARLDELQNLMKSFGTVNKGTVINLNLIPGSGTRVLVGGAQKGRDIPGDDFFNALLKIWIGNAPVDGDLKKGLLGGK